MKHPAERKPSEDETVEEYASQDFTLTSDQDPAVSEKALVVSRYYDEDGYLDNNTLGTPRYITLCYHFSHTMCDDPGEYESVLELCRNRYCRIMLAMFPDDQRSLTVRDLTDHIIECDPAVSREDFDEILLSLYHLHIPQLAERELVEFEHEHNLVKPTEKLDQFEPYLSPIFEADPLLSGGLITH